MSMPRSLALGRGVDASGARQATHYHCAVWAAGRMTGWKSEEARAGTLPTPCLAQGGPSTTHITCPCTLRRTNLPINRHTCACHPAGTGQGREQTGLVPTARCDGRPVCQLAATAGSTFASFGDRQLSMAVPMACDVGYRATAHVPVPGGWTRQWVCGVCVKADSRTQPQLCPTCHVLAPPPAQLCCTSGGRAARQGLHTHLHGSGRTRCGRQLGARRGRPALLGQALGQGALGSRVRGCQSGSCS